MNYVEIGEKIRKYRKEKGVSQEQLAEKVGISVTHMSHIETANTKLSLPVLVSVAEVLGVGVDALVKEKCAECEENLVEELRELLSECNESEIRVIMDVARAAKQSLKNEAAFRESK